MEILKNYSFEDQRLLIKRLRKEIILKNKINNKL